MLFFDWDETKNFSNRQKHHLSFDSAVQVFDDPYALMLQDRIENGEERWQTIGRMGHTLVALVAHTVHFDAHREVIRIISARKADRLERKRYEKQIP